MTEFLSLCAFAVLSGAILIIVSKGEKELSVLISVIIYIIVMIYAVTRTGEFFNAIKEYFGEYDIPNLKIIIKAGGIALVSTVVSVICENTGQKGISTAIEILAVIEIIGITIPIISDFFSAFINLLGE